MKEWWNSQGVWTLKAKRGFTLFEIVVVLSIIVVLATMGMIGYQAAVPP